MLDFEFRCIKGILESIKDPLFDECYTKIGLKDKLKLTQVVFNPSLCLVCKGIYFGITRVLMKNSSAGDGKVIPGNSSICKNEKYPGQFFMWNDWKSLMSPLEEMCVPFVISNGLVFPMEILHNQLQEPEACYLSTDDYRVVMMDGRLVIYGTMLDFIFVASVTDDGRLYLSRVLTSVVNGQGKNMVPLKMVIEKDDSCSEFTYIDWFYPKGVRFSIFRSGKYYEKLIMGENAGELSREEYGIKSKQVKEIMKTTKLFQEEYLECKYPIVGSGSWDSGKDKELYGVNYGIMPMFSLSTPVIEYNGMYLGAGHTKIHTDAKEYPYLKGSKIQRFREKVHSTLEKKYKSKYKRHLGASPFRTRYYAEGSAKHSKTETCKGYIYLIYFYLLSKDLKEMYISDSYLPVSPVENLEYTFSLFFPVGIFLEGNELTVTGGYGDYYPMSLHFDVRQVEKDCRHDITNLKMESYDYYMI